MHRSLRGIHDDRLGDKGERGEEHPLYIVPSKSGRFCRHILSLRHRDLSIPLLDRACMEHRSPVHLVYLPEDVLLAISAHLHVTDILSLKQVT